MFKKTLLAVATVALASPALAESGYSIGYHSLEFDTENRGTAPQGMGNTEANKSPHFNLSYWSTSDLSEGSGWGFVGHLENHSPSGVVAGNNMDDSFKGATVVGVSWLNELESGSVFGVGATYAHQTAAEDYSAGSGGTQNLNRTSYGIDVSLASQLGENTSSLITVGYGNNLSVEKDKDGNRIDSQDKTTYYGVNIQTGITDNWFVGGGIDQFSSTDTDAAGSKRKGRISSIYVGRMLSETMGLRFTYTDHAYDDTTGTVYYLNGHSYGISLHSANNSLAGKSMSERSRFWTYDGFASGQLD